MINFKKITYIIFILFLIYEITATCFFEVVPNIKMFGISLFNLLAFLYFPFVIYGYFNYIEPEKSKSIKTFFIILLIYALYQLIIVLPLTIINYGFIRDINYLSMIVIRLSFLLIPFIYWFILNNKNDIKVINILINIAGIAFFFMGIYNYFFGEIMKTNTGESRLIMGTATIFFSATLVNNTRFFGALRNNILMILISIAGMIFANHRSGYISIFIVFIFTFILNARRRGRKVSYIFSLIIMILALIAVLQNSFLKDNFLSRISSAFDFNDANYLDRELRNELALENFKENPVNGTLLSGYYYKAGAMSEYQNNWMPHNFIADILSTQGIIGFTFIFSFLFIIIKTGLKNKDDPITISSLNVILYYITFALANVTFLNLTTILIFCLYSALIFKRDKILNYHENTLN